MNERETIILGALLHDIGKFVQRAQQNPTSQHHTYWGAKWFSNNLREKLYRAKFSIEELNKIERLINVHHDGVEFVTLADYISAGMDRIPIEEEENKKGDPFSERLVSIFSRISTNNKHKQDKYYNLASLNNLEKTIPETTPQYSYQEHSGLLNEFNEEIKSIDFAKLSYQEVIDIMYFMLWKYTWCSASAVYKTEPDISLFDHLKTTAAIVTCLYDYKQENLNSNLDIETPAFCLIGGDISGIQNYIFEVLSQQGKVAKSLRGRSLFVQLISEIASHKMLHRFKLSLCNLIISAGGNFYILVPNLREAKDKVETLQKEFDEWTFNQLNAELSINISIKMGITGRELANFSHLLEEIRKSVSHKKSQPHKSILINNGKWNIEKFLFSKVVEGDEKACQRCYKFPIKEDNEDKLCERCLNDTEIGKLLPNSKYIAFFDNSNGRFDVLGYSFELWEEINTLKNKPYLILALNNTKATPPVTGFKYLATYIPTNEKGEIKTFEEIAEEAYGDKLLAYLKIDADNLGYLLKQGFDQEKLEERRIKPSISRYTTFSRMLETFFTGWIQMKLKKSEFKEIYIVFSGGDDCFIVGPWNKIIDFAIELRKDFTLYCAENTDLTFSAGIILSDPYRPISFCAKEVNEVLEEKSKKRENKDGITIFDHTMGWKELEDKIIKRANKIIEWIESEPPLISRNFAYILWECGVNYQEYEKSKNTKYLKFVPILAESIKRNLDPEIHKEVFDWATRLLPSKEKAFGDDLPYLKTIMEYVLTRTKNHTKGGRDAQNM